MQFNTEDISVIIPSYNRVHFIDRAITSVTNQTSPAGEIIIVDDGSTDGTASHIRKNYSFVRLLTQKNRGVSAARNAGITMARNEWLAFLDSDDTWLPRKLETHMAELAKYKGKFRFCFGDERWIRNGREVTPPKHYAKQGGNIFNACLPRCIISSSNVIIHKSIFEEIGNFDEGLPACEDYDMWLRITVKYPALYIPGPSAAKYDGHPGQLSAQSGLDKYRILSICKILQTHDLADNEHKALIQTLRQKSKIYCNGARKRGKMAEAEDIQSIIAPYLSIS